MRQENGERCERTRLRTEGMWSVDRVWSGLVWSGFFYRGVEGMYVCMDVQQKTDRTVLYVCMFNFVCA